MIGTTTNKVVSRINVGILPVNIAITPKGTIAYVANAGSDSVSAINTGTNTVTATVTVGANPVNPAAF